MTKSSSYIILYIGPLSIVFYTSKIWMQVLTCYWHTCVCCASHMPLSGSVWLEGLIEIERRYISNQAGWITGRPVTPLLFTQSHTYTRTHSHKHTPYPSPQSCKGWTESPRPPLSTSLLLCFWPSLLLSVRWPSSSPSESEGEKKKIRKRHNEPRKGQKNGQVDLLLVSPRTTHSPGLFISFFKI